MTNSIPIEVAIDAIDPVAVIDTVNEALRELVLVGAIEDTDDDGWAWTPLPGEWSPFKAND